MTNTARMKWPIPGENVDPWFDAFVDMMNEVDASGYAAREDRNIICMGGGTCTWSASTNTLSWAATIELLSANTGFLWQVAAGSLTLNDGDEFYLNLVRAPTSNVALVPQTAANLSTAPDGDAACVVCVRRGTQLFFRNGRVMNSGDSFAVFQSNGVSGGGGGGSPRAALPERWTQANVAASQTAATLSAEVSTNFDQIRAVRAGSIVGLATQFTQAVTGGTATVRVSINGTPGTLNIAHTSGANTSGGSVTQGSGIDSYVAGDLIGVQITTDAGFLPVTTDVEAWLEVEDAS